MPGEFKAPGLAPPDGVIETALSVAREVEAARMKALADAATMRSLRASLDDLADSKKAIEPTRGNLVALVQTVANGLRPAFSTAVGKLADDRAVIVDHAAVALLDALADMLRDLDLGRVDPALEPSPGRAGRAFVARDQRRRQALLDAVKILKHRKKKCASLEDAEAFLAERIRRTKPGLRVGGKPVDADRLKAWRNHSKEWK
jgi:hypothetical protein